MSTLSVVKNNLFDLMTGKIDFKTMIANDGAAIEANIASAPKEVQPALTAAYSDFKATASAVVGLGQSALGTLIADAENGSLETMLLNLMVKAGIPTAGPLSIAEQAAVMAMVNGLQAILQRTSLYLTTQTGVSGNSGGSPTPPPPEEQKT